MPSMVSAVRILLRPSALNAMRKTIRTDMASPPPAARRKAPLWHERIAGSSGLPAARARAHSDEARHNFHSLLQLAARELGVRAVRDAQTQADRLQLAVDEQPRPPSGLDKLQRSKQGVNRRGGCRGPVLRSKPGRGLCRTLGAFLGFDAGVK